MRSRERRMRGCGRALLVIVCLMGSPVVVANPPTAALPTEADVAQAVEQVEADPNLARRGKTTTLKWRNDGTDRGRGLSLPVWFLALFDWLLHSLRLVVWVAVTIFVAVLVVLIVRRLHKIERLPRGSPRELPTHVRELDIRPESLPDDIGAAALQLWERGERRAALPERIVSALAAPAGLRLGRRRRLSRVHVLENAGLRLVEGALRHDQPQDEDPRAEQQESEKSAREALDEAGRVEEVEAEAHAAQAAEHHDHGEKLVQAFHHGNLLARASSRRRQALKPSA